MAISRAGPGEVIAVHTLGSEPGDFDPGALQPPTRSVALVLNG